MAVAKRCYQTALPEDQAVALEALAARLGVSLSETLRRAVAVLVAVSATPAPERKVAPEPEELPKAAPRPAEPEPEDDEEETAAPALFRRRIHKRKPAPGNFLEVWKCRRTGLYYYQFSWRDPRTGTRRCHSESRFQTAEECARTRDSTARKIAARLGIFDEPMNFPLKGEVDARTGRRRTD